MSMHSRTNPYLCKILNRFLLNKEGSTKETYHVSLSVKGSELPFLVGDSIAIYPDNDKGLVDEVIASLSLSPDQEVLDRSGTPFTLQNFLLKKANISKCSSNLLKNLKENGVRSDRLTYFLSAEGKVDSVPFLQSHQLVDILRVFPDSTLSAQQLCSSLLPMMPRFYSVASSPSMYADQVHLTVASLIYETAGGPRRGIGSHFLGHSAIINETTIPVYVQSSNGFTLPEDPNASIIMVGPGTGIAPFRAFLQEREAKGHLGSNWLFFGERNRSTDFYYEDYFLQLERLGKLRLDLAFSRDTSEKVYVQNKLWDSRKDIWACLEKGAYLYVCGDAEKMAKDVDLTLLRIAQDAGLTETDSGEWLKSLKKSRRYLQDVY
jgi:sulfite reductase (NADPH) flavoprotein alpha-component